MSAETPVTRKKLFVSHKDESIRMFKSSFMDFFSRVPFYVPLILYIPFIGFLTYQSFFTYEVNWLVYIGLVAGGIFFWTFAEYTLHRFLFHFHPKSEIGKRIHFVAHGVHHDYPNDSMRLVMPPSLSLPLAALFYGAYYLIFGPALMNAFFAGFVIGYLCYDEFHYATHHANWQWGWFQRMKKHHMKHHYQNPDEGFGVSSSFWDRVFRTMFK